MRGASLPSPFSQVRARLHGVRPADAVVRGQAKQSPADRFPGHSETSCDDTDRRTPEVPSAGPPHLRDRQRGACLDNGQRSRTAHVVVRGAAVERLSYGDGAHPEALCEGIERGTRKTSVAEGADLVRCEPGVVSPLSHLQSLSPVQTPCECFEIEPSVCHRRNSARCVNFALQFTSGWARSFSR